MNTMELLFSYGTLQDSDVQIETFGRVLAGSKDRLLDYRLESVKIDDNEVVRLSGKAHHLIAVPATSEYVKGVIFKITWAELIQADKYEVSAYHRVLGSFKSGKQAWVYVQTNGHNKQKT